MKIKNYNIITAFALFSLLLTGCSNDFVEVESTSSVTSEAVFSSFTNTNIFLNELYSSMPLKDEWFGIDPQANWSDDSQATFGWVASNNGIARRDYSSSSAPRGAGTWRSFYTSIRKANILITGIEAAGEGTYSDDEKSSLLAQSKFMRAFFYLRLAKNFGGVPLIDKVLDRSTGDDITFPRSTFSEIIDFVVQDCAAAANGLPDTAWPSDGTTRPTKGAALSQMAEAQLFAERWGDVVITTQQIMNMNYSIVSDYESLFRPATEVNSEVIFDIEFNESFPQDNNVYNSPRVSPVTGVAAGWGHILPTQELVDAYEFKDGAPGDDAGHANDPYVGRDDRFEASILYNGSDYRGGKIWTFFDPTLQPGGFSNTFDDNFTHQGTLTGYYYRKLLNPDIEPSETARGASTGVGTINAIVYRFGEILLMYAEAKNEASGPDASVYDAVNQLRARGGLQPLSGLDQAELREFIRNERRVELAFEGDKRYWDVIRWKIAGQVYNKSKGGMRILNQPDGSKTYTRVDAFRGNMNFVEPRDYLFPIPQAMIDVNPKLVGDQNPGW